MAEVFQEKVVSALPDPLKPSTHYYVRVGAGFDHYLSDSTGTIAHKLNAPDNLDDSITSTTKGWSSDKITAELDAALASANTTPAPQLSATVVNGNEGTSPTVTIENYNASHTYTLSSDNEPYVTVSRSGDTLTINLLDIPDDEADEGGTRSATVTVMAFDGANYGFADQTTIAVTSNRVDIDDAAIQVVDFSAAILTSTDIDLESLKPVSQTDGAEFTSVVIAQDGGEGNWKKATPTLDTAAKNFASEVSFSADKSDMFTSHSIFASAGSIDFWDDDGIIKNRIISANTPTPQNDTTVSSWTASSRPTWMTDDFIVYGMQMTNDGRHVIATVYGNLGSGDALSLIIVELTNRYDQFGAGTVISDVSSTSITGTTSNGLSVQSTYFGYARWAMNNEGTKMIGQADLRSSGHALLCEVYLGTPLDLSTWSIGAGVAHPNYSSSQDESERFSAPLMAPDGATLYFSTGRSRDDEGEIYSMPLGVPWDLSTAGSEVSMRTSNTQLYYLTSISLDGARLIAGKKNDDGGNYLTSILYDIDDASTLSFVNSPAIQSTTATHLLFYDYISEETKACIDGYIWYVSGQDAKIFNGLEWYDIAGAAPVGDVDFIGFTPSSNPDLRFDVEPLAGDLDVSGGAALVELDAGAWAWDGTDMSRQITYSETAVAGDNLQFRISDMDAGLIIDKVQFDLVREYS